MTSHQADFLIQNSKDGQIYFTLRASNHEVVLTSETYTTLAAANNGIAAVRTAAQLPSNFKVMLSRREEPYFVLRSANHEIIGTSEMYSSTAARDEGITACQRAAREAVVVDRRVRGVTGLD